MELERDAAPGIHRIADAHVNWYLVEDGDDLLVVDAGLPRSWRSLHEALAALGRAPGDLRALVLTHAHFDHVGFAERARTRLGLPIWVHGRDADLARHPWRYRHERPRAEYALRHPGFIRVFADMGAAGALWVDGAREVRRFGDGEVLDVPGRPRVVATPGHTDGHSSLHFDDRDAVMAGDALVTFDPYTTLSGPRTVARAATADSALALRSLAALEDTAAATVLPGHGATWTGGVARAVAQARAAGVQ